MDTFKVRISYDGEATLIIEAADENDVEAIVQGQVNGFIVEGGTIDYDIEDIEMLHEGPKTDDDD